MISLQTKVFFAFFCLFCLTTNLNLLAQELDRKEIATLKDKAKARVAHLWECIQILTDKSKDDLLKNETLKDANTLFSNPKVNIVAVTGLKNKVPTVWKPIVSDYLWSLKRLCNKYDEIIIEPLDISLVGDLAEGVDGGLHLRIRVWQHFIAKKDGKVVINDKDEKIVSVVIFSEKSADGIHENMILKFGNITVDVGKSEIFRQ
jgi:hypothetical protein